MQTGTASRTALGAAGYRAAHQVLEQGRILADPLALRILGDDAERVVREARENEASRGMRIFIAVPSRFVADAAVWAIATTEHVPLRRVHVGSCRRTGEVRPTLRSLSSR